MSNIQSQLKSLTNSPGIYLFYNSRRELIYVGKATSLKSRVRSYFSSFLSFPPASSRTPAGQAERESQHLQNNHEIPAFAGMTIKKDIKRPIESLIHQVKKIKTVKTDSVLEAVILEGQYIKKYHPKYNVDWKDDKSWNYLYLTNEPFPKLKTIRQHEASVIPAGLVPHSSGTGRAGIPSAISLISHSRDPRFREDDTIAMFGPFPNLNTRETLKLLHKLFYISRCSAPLLSEEGLGGGKNPKPCFDYHLGTCLGVCTGEIATKEYKQKVIKPLTDFLSGHKKKLLSSLKKQMLLASKQENFEEATRLRNQIKSLSHIHDVTLLNKDLFNGPVGTGRDLSLQITRIEAYDISNFGSDGKVGSMVVFDKNGPVKSEYRKFKIKTVAGQSDVDCLKEIIERRLKNNWPLPDIILVDGGKPQVNVVKKIVDHLPLTKEINFSKEKFISYAIAREGVKNIPVIGLAKGPTRQKNEFIFDKNIKIKGDTSTYRLQDWILDNKNLLIQARDEAHRFAITYQKKLRKTT